ncbi:MAG: response regulator transcription factor [Proteobacteria bacterium]|nr:response regulator transcription factor [Pseudomonadota bacterium]
MGERVLVVDDERDVCRLLSYNLERAGFETESAATAADALLCAGRQLPTVVVLDVGLPDLSGVEVCRRLRADRDLAGVGILMLTALGADEDRIAGLSAGADDYVVKPFNVDEVVLRVRALARRIGERDQARDQRPGTLFRSGQLIVDPITHDVRLGDQTIELRPLEFKLLVTLLAKPGRVFSRQELLRTVWDMEGGGNPRTVDVHIRRLRQNLGACADQIETVPGFGYRARQS